MWTETSDSGVPRLLRLRTRSTRVGRLPKDEEVWVWVVSTPDTSLEVSVVSTSGTVSIYRGTLGPVRRIHGRFPWESNKTITRSVQTLSVYRVS